MPLLLFFRIGLEYGSLSFPIEPRLYVSPLFFNATIWCSYDISTLLAI